MRPRHPSLGRASRLAAAACSIAIAILWLPAAARGQGGAAFGGGGEVEEIGCRGVQLGIRVPRVNVELLVPAPFEVVEDPFEPGTVRLDLIMQKCDAYIIEGKRSDDVVFVHPNVPIAWPTQVADEPPDSFRHLVSYQLWFATNNPDLVEYLRDRGATDRDVRLVSGLVYEESADGSFVRFEARAPTPSPFTATARLAPRSPGLPLPGDIFRAVPLGVQWFDIEHDIEAGPLTDWTIDPAEGSQLDILLCQSPRSFSDVRPSPATDESVSFREPHDAVYTVRLQTHVQPGPIGHAACGCRGADRDAQLAEAQRQILQMLRPAAGVDLTTLDDESDLAALAALGYGVYPHRAVSLSGMGWPVADALAPQDPEQGRPAPGRPTLLLYAPAPGSDATEPERFDFPYRLAGWAYLFPFSFGRHPDTTGGGQPFGPCLERDEWFVHERGVHPFESGGMDTDPPEEEVHGTAPGNTLPGPWSAGDLPHTRAWDLHAWLDGDEIPTVSMLSPSKIAGVDPHVGTSPPASAGVPWFYYPRRAADVALTQSDSPDPVQLGEKARVTYTITVANLGPSRATGVTLTDELPRHSDGVSVTAAQGSCMQTKTTVTCRLGTLPSGSATQVRIVVRPRKKGTIANTASARANEVELKELADTSRGWTTAGATADNVAADGCSECVERTTVL